MREILSLLIVLSSVVACGPSDWVPVRGPTEVAVGNPQLAYEASLRVLRDNGYRIVEDDPQRFFIRAQSRVDGDVVGGPGYAVARVSYLSFQGTPDGKLRILASGFHVRTEDGQPVMNFFLDKEIRDIVRVVQQVAAAAVPLNAPAAPGAAPEAQ